MQRSASAKNLRVRPRTTALWICFALVVLVIVPYAQVGWHEFLLLDDKDYVTENAHVRAGLTWVGVQWAFVAPHAANWHPLTWLSHMLDCELFGLNAGAHHLVNVAFHAANTVLLFLALRMMTGALWRSAAVAAFFAVHPLRVESVAWVAERKDVLAGFFWMLTLVSYAWYARRPGPWRYAVVFAALGLGLLSKSMAVTLPCVLLLLDAWPLRRGSVRGIAEEDSVAAAEYPRRTWRQLVIEKLPLLALAIVISKVAVVSQSDGGALKGFEQVGLAGRLANALVSYVAYLWQMVWPVKLAPFYPHSAKVSTDLTMELYLPAAAAALLLGGLTILALRQRKQRPWLAVGWLWYLGTLVPVIGLVQIGSQARADRYTYLPLIGIAVALVWAVGESAARREQVRRIAICAAVAVGVGCLVLTWVQASHWVSGVALFEHAVRVTEKNYFAYNELGSEYKARKDAARAEDTYVRALRELPGYAAAQNNLGVCLSERGEVEKAREAFERAAQMDVRFALPHRNLALIHAQGGRDAEAEAAFRRALELDPLDAKTVRAFAFFCGKRARLAEAATWFERTLEFAPEDADAWVSLGLIRAQQGDKAKGIAYLEHALRVAPQHAGARKSLAALRASP